MPFGWSRMKSIRWLSGGTGHSAAALLLVASALGCGLQEYPGGRYRGLATGGTKGTVEPPPATADAAAVTPPDDRPPPEAGVALEAGAVRPDAVAPPPSGPGV